MAADSTDPDPIDPTSAESGTDNVKLDTPQPVLAVEAEEPDDLHALAAAAETAVPQDPVYRRVSVGARVAVDPSEYLRMTMV